MKRALSLLLIAALIVCLFPLRVFAEETVPETSIPETVQETEESVVAEETTQATELTEFSLEMPEEDIVETESLYPDELDQTNEELFAGYVERLFYGNGEMDLLSVGDETAGARLTGDEALAYQALVPIIKQIACGQRASTIIMLGTNSATDVYVPFTGTYAEFDRRAVVRALRTDYPYEMYWFDYVTGFVNQYPSNGILSRYTIKLTVAEKFRGRDQFTIDTAKAAATTTAVSNARAIASRYSEKTDYEKLVGFRDEICNLVQYDDYAADYDIFTSDSGPWQMIYVFDRNPSTNVVCEGYAKAFQYLCDISGLTCYSVHGYVPGGHMWNIVTLEDKNYLVDVTWYDGGWDCLFLGGGSGSVSGGYTFTSQYGNTVTYRYRDEMLPTWGTEILTITSRQYNPSEHTISRHVVEPTCTEKGYTLVQCRCGYSYQENVTAATGHRYQNGLDGKCDNCGQTRAVSISMHRLYNPNSGEHFYTGSVEERDSLVRAGWDYEGIAWNAPIYGGDPVYRMYNPNSGDHHYTMSAEERDDLRDYGWRYEGVCWNSVSPTSGMPLYRLYNPNADCGSHHYTGSSVERNNLVNVGWIYEGIGWFGMKN